MDLQFLQIIVLLFSENNPYSIFTKILDHYELSQKPTIWAILAQVDRNFIAVLYFRLLNYWS